MDDVKGLLRAPSLISIFICGKYRKLHHLLLIVTFLFSFVLAQESRVDSILEMCFRQSQSFIDYLEDGSEQVIKSYGTFLLKEDSPYSVLEAEEISKSWALAEVVTVLDGLRLLLDHEGEFSHLTLNDFDIPKLSLMPIECKEYDTSIKLISEKKSPYELLNRERVRICKQPNNMLYRLDFVDIATTTAESFVDVRSLKNVVSIWEEDEGYRIENKEILLSQNFDAKGQLKHADEVSISVEGVLEHIDTSTSVRRIEGAGDCYISVFEYPLY